MGTQISIKLSDRTYAAAIEYSTAHGYDTVQDLIRELLRERLFDNEPERITGLSTYLASEKALAKVWLSPEEEEAWAHLQKET